MSLDPERVRRALYLTADVAGPGHVVSGGNASWFVDPETGRTCPDRQIRGPGCKHEIAVELAALTPALLAGLRQLAGGADGCRLPRARRPRAESLPAGPTP